MKSINKDPYVAENGCLINLLGTNDKEALAKEEIVQYRKALRSILADRHDFSEVSTKEFYYDLHHSLFGKIYSWAGQPRTIDMIKRERLLGGNSVRYSHYAAINSNLDAIFERMSRLKSISGIAQKQEIADYVANLWWIHPFREGNTRQHTAYLALLAKSLGYAFDWEKYASVSRESNIRDYFVCYTVGGEPRRRYFEKFTSFYA